ncbi:Calmodulin (EF-Hand superfamily) [Phytophthora cinnamomi]|uniref:Calmodulin (EF-Hand superfamily) n=2 Tax=Phytophthora cinnamomi TaxID=4785 RepID=UPI003559DC91|nr:Calmodulin (EF-Hand superfamily) [Phytophthora cinnamomi]
MAEQSWGGDANSNYGWGADPYGAEASVDAAVPSDYYAQEQGNSVDAGYNSNQYWRVDNDVYPIFLELAPGAQGESVDLGELPELCRRVGRPLQDEHEQFRLMQELDTTNAMIILRHDFVSWLLREIHAQEQLRIEAEPRQIPVATPAWEEVVQEVAEVDMMLGSKPTVYYYNTLSGESIWELPSLVHCLWSHLESQEAAQQEARMAQDGVPAFVRSRRSDEKSSDDSREMVQQLRELFVKYDDDKSGYLDPAEFEDLCVRVGQTVNGREGLLTLMQKVDPYSPPIISPDLSEQQPVVSWEALKYYWITNSPFQRRTRLGEAQFSSWERIDLLHKRTTPVLFCHTTTLQERWGHPGMEQRVAERLNHLFPSNKLDWGQKIDLFVDVQWQQQQQGAVVADRVESRQWSFETCWRVLTQLNHPMARLQHVQYVMQQLQTRFGGPTIADESEDAISLDEAAMRAWLLYCTKKIDMNGWEEVFDAEGQTYYYHEVDGTTQWDPPQLQTQMASMLSKLGGGQQNLSADEQIARVFRQYDADESGEMTLDEFQHFYRALLGRGAASGGGVSDAQIRQVFSVLDASGDGSVTLEEFQFWWKTKLQLEVQETNEVETITREQRRREICREFLENADAIVLSSASNLKKEGDAGSPNEQGSQVCFESNMLPRVVALLGEFPLRGLAYRRALNELVADPMEQLVSLERFLVWYDRFESAEREKMELQRAKQRAQAELRAQHEAQAAARDKQRRRRKQMRTLNVMNDQAAAMTEHETQQQRDKKIAVLFKTFDTDGSGLLDEDELLQLTKALGHDMDAAQVNRMMKVMDSSGDGRINLEEFLAFWKAFEHRHPAPVSAAMLNQTRRDAVSEPATAVEAAPPPQPLSTSDAVASLAVNLEMVKDRALKLTLADLKGFLSDWRDDVVEKRIEQQAEHDEAEALKKWQITNQDVAKLCHDKFEDLEDEDACFLAMAKAKLRKQHYNPTPNWTFAKILELVERNPLDEAVIQRSLHATNEKLGAMLEAEQQSSTNNQEENRKGYGTVVDTVTLDSDLMLVRTVHQIMYEFPSNPRLQLLGQAVLSKLLPSAYVRAAYKAKIDPYFNL